MWMVKEPTANRSDRFDRARTSLPTVADQGDECPGSRPIGSFFLPTRFLKIISTRSTARSFSTFPSSLQASTATSVGLASSEAGGQSVGGRRSGRLGMRECGTSFSRGQAGALDSQSPILPMRPRGDVDSLRSGAVIRRSVLLDCENKECRIALGSSTTAAITLAR
jgi:hypothetical protein